MIPSLSFFAPSVKRTWPVVRILSMTTADPDFLRVHSASLSSVYYFCCAPCWNLAASDRFGFFYLVLVSEFGFILNFQKHLQFSSLSKDKDKMTRGNQRDLAREKNMKKQQELKKKQGANAKDGNSGMSTATRMDRDAEAMRIKQQKAAEKKAAEEAASAAGAKKVAKVDPLKM